MPIYELPIFTYYDRQRFAQFGVMDCANWYIVEAPSGKKQKALYPCMGRKHITSNNDETKLNFQTPPREIFKSIDFTYIIENSIVWMINAAFDRTELINNDFVQTKGDLFFSFLPVVQGDDSLVYSALCDGERMYIINEQSKTMVTVTDANTPKNPLYIAAYGNRFVVAGANTTQFNLTQINLGSTPIVVAGDASDIFTIASAAVFAQETGVIRQFGVLHNQLYIFTDFTTGIWSNTPSQVFNNSTGLFVSFPWKKNTSLDWDFGIADAQSLDIDFGMMCWLGRNRNGLVTFMVSQGQMPQPISTQAINVLLQNSTGEGALSPFLSLDVDGFLYQYENSIFYRVCAVDLDTLGVADTNTSADSIEFNFDDKTWHRCIELDQTRNLIQKHVFFSNKHLALLNGQNAIYEMAGNIYTNEIADQADISKFIAYPFRYELITPTDYEKDYSESIYDYVQIDFVFGDKDFIYSLAPFENTVFVVSETSTSENPQYIVAEDGSTFVIADGSNTPDLNSPTYNDLFKPNITLYFSDDSGISFHSADNREFSQLGQYQWRMRWYQLGVSRNRCFKLVCVSPAPIIILGATMDKRRASGGAN